MTVKQVEERLKKNDLIIIPVGSTEIHGPHAPPGEDTFLVTSMAEKAYPGIEAILDYMVELHDDIMNRFPAGVLPPVEEVTNRSKEDIEAVTKGPLKDGRHIYTLAYPP
jgi:hypothetical protein